MDDDSSLLSIRSPNIASEGRKLRSRAALLKELSLGKKLMKRDGK